MMGGSGPRRCLTFACCCAIVRVASVRAVVVGSRVPGWVPYRTSPTSSISSSSSTPIIVVLRVVVRVLAGLV